MLIFMTTYSIRDRKYLCIFRDDLRTQYVDFTDFDVIQKNLNRLFTDSFNFSSMLHHIHTSTVTPIPIAIPIASEVNF